MGHAYRAPHSVHGDRGLRVGGLVHASLSARRISGVVDSFEGCGAQRCLGDGESGADAVPRLTSGELPHWTSSLGYSSAAPQGEVDGVRRCPPWWDSLLCRQGWVAQDIVLLSSAKR